MNLLTEGMYDKGIFKAVFMAGGPGSGKTFISKQLFGIPDNLKKATVTVGGLKVINSDKFFAHILRKHGFHPEELAQYPQHNFDEFQKSGDEGGSGLRHFAQDLNKAEKERFTDGKLGMIIDSTGSNFKKVKRQKKQLEEQGYDCYMVFVMTSLKTAQARNKKRAEEGDRELPEDIVEKSWKATRKNLGGLKALFRENFVMVDNDKFLNPEEARHKFSSLVKNYANKWINAPFKNPKAKTWMKTMLKLKKAGIVNR